MALVFIYTTTATMKDAEKLAEILIKQQLAACVSVGKKVKSHYVWQTRREWAEEYPITIKTTAEKQSAVCRFLQHNHSYELPEIVCLPVLYASNEYQQWVEKQVSGSLKTTTS